MLPQVVPSIIVVMLSMMMMMMMIFTTTTTTTLAYTITTTMKPITTHHYSSSSSSSSSLLLKTRRWMASTTTETTTTTSSTSQWSSFDTYQPGVTTDICWKDDDDNNNDSSTTTTTSLTQGAQEKDVCVVSYVGKIMNTNTIFNQNNDFVFQIGSGKTMPGFDIGCRTMLPNTTRMIRVPPNRAYGVQGTYDGKIPPNADLEFSITMKRFVSYQQNPILAEITLFGELRLIGLIGCVAVLALPPFFQ